MKKLYYFTPYFFFILLGMPSKGEGQCYTSYTTYNYFCDLDSLILEAVPEGVPPYSFIWETGETTQQIMIPLALGDYMLTVTDANGCVAVINCHVKPYPEVLYYPFNQNACEGEVVTLFLDWFRDSIPGATYLWSTGETTPSIQITDDITWSATVTDPSTGCEYVIPANLFEFHDVPDPEIIGPTEICDGQSITLSVAGGPFGYLVWYPMNEYTETVEVTEPGEYSVFANNENASWCWAYDTIVITEGEIPPPIVEGPPDLCEGQTGTVEVTNHLLFETFLWSNGETGYSFVADEPGTYAVTVTEEGGCTATASIDVEDAIENNITADITSATCGESNGSIIISYTISGSYDFLWSNGETSQNLEDVPSGFYSVTVTAEDGCSSTIEVTIPEDEIDINIDENIVPNTSCTEFNGSIDIFITPGGTYDYAWSTGATTEDIEGLFPGAYSVTVTEGLTCSSSADFIIEDLSAAPDLQSNILPASCGETNGSIDLQLTGGTAPFSYMWSNGMTTENISDIPAGNYSVTVSAADGCSVSTSLTVPNVDLPISINGIVTPNTSCSSANGSIDISTSPSGNYIFTWSTGATTEDLSGIGSGVYMVTVSLGASCLQTDTFIVTSESLPFSISGNTTHNTSCSTPTGALDLNISPANTYTYIWSTGQTGEDLQNLAGGNYTVTVTSPDGCSITSSFTVDDLSSSFAISGLSIANTSCQVPNGAINISVQPPGTYSFLWSNGTTTEDLQNISGGSFQVTVSDLSGCTAVSSFTVDNQSATFTLSAIPSPNNFCTTPNGTIDLTVSPLGSYTFLWSNGITSEDLQSMTDGVFTVTVTDNNLCSSTAAYTILSNTSDPMLSSAITNELCGASNGAVDLNVSPAGSTFIWSDGTTSEDLINLSAGIYNVTVTSPNGCFTIDTFIVSNASNNFSLLATPFDNSSCVVANGSLDLLITPPGSYSIAWSTGQTSEDLSGLAAGTYTVTVTDNLNCSSIASFTIQNNTPDPVIAHVITPASCGNDNGSISLIINPPSGNIFQWSNGSSSEDLQNLISGNYTVTVTASNGCSVTTNFNVPDNNSNFTISGTALDNSSCTTANGSIDLNISTAGTYTYTWSTGDNTADLQNLAAGIYAVTVTDQFNCISTSSFIISDITIIPQLENNITPATCGQNNGSIDLTVILSVNSTFVWSNGNTSQDLIDIAPGIYQVTVTSNNGCTAEMEMEVPNQNSNFALASITTDEASCIQPNGSINLTVTPVGNYTFIWSGGETTEDLANLASGLYEVTVTDNSNCSASDIFIIENITSPPLVSGIFTNAKCGGNNGRIDLTVIPSSGNTFLWSTGDQTEDLENLPAGIYNVTVTDVNGCTVKSNFELPGSTPIELLLDADISSIGQGGTVTCSLHINVPLSAIESIVWLPSNLMSCHDLLCLEQTISIVEQTQISAMVVDTHGCFATANLLLDVNPEYQVFIPNVFTPNNDGPNDKFTVYANDEVEEVVILEIFDRWGNCVFINEVFPPNEPGYGWDGIYSGKMMNPDVFAYRAVVRYSNGEEHHFKGDVTLVR